MTCFSCLEHPHHWLLGFEAVEGGFYPSVSQGVKTEGVWTIEKTLPWLHTPSLFLLLAGSNIAQWSPFFPPLVSAPVTPPLMRSDLPCGTLGMYLDFPWGPPQERVRWGQMPFLGQHSTQHPAWSMKYLRHSINICWANKPTDGDFYDIVLKYRIHWISICWMKWKYVTDDNTSGSFEGLSEIIS